MKNHYRLMMGFLFVFIGIANLPAESINNQEIVYRNFVFNYLHKANTHTLLVNKNSYKTPLFLARYQDKGVYQSLDVSDQKHRLVAYSSDDSASIRLVNTKQKVTLFNAGYASDKSDNKGEKVNNFYAVADDYAVTGEVTKSSLSASLMNRAKRKTTYISSSWSTKYKNFSLSNRDMLLAGNHQQRPTGEFINVRLIQKDQGNRLSTLSYANTKNQKTLNVVHGVDKVNASINQQQQKYSLSVIKPNKTMVVEVDGHTGEFEAQSDKHWATYVKDKNQRQLSVGNIPTGETLFSMTYNPADETVRGHSKDLSFELLKFGRERYFQLQDRFTREQKAFASFLRINDTVSFHGFYDHYLFNGFSAQGQHQLSVLDGQGLVGYMNLQYSTRNATLMAKYRQYTLNANYTENTANLRILENNQQKLHITGNYRQTEDGELADLVVDKDNQKHTVAIAHDKQLTQVKAHIDDAKFNARIDQNNIEASLVEYQAQGGRYVLLTGNDFIKIKEGNVGHVLDRLSNDFDVDVSFDKQLGNGRLIFNHSLKTLTGEFDGNFAQIKFGSDGFAHYVSADKRQQIKLGAPKNRVIPVITGYYDDDFLTARLDNTQLKYDQSSQVAGLYTSTNNYIIKVQTAGEDVLANDAQIAINKALKGDFDREERNRLISSNIKNVSVNARELVNNRLRFKNRDWNNLLMSLAWDVGDVQLSSDDIISIADAKDRKAQAYVVLNRNLKGGVNKQLNNKQRSLAYALAGSIRHQQPMRQSMGVKRFDQQAGIYFNQGIGNNAISLPGMVMGMESGFIDASIPLVGKYGRTALTANGFANRMYMQADSEIYDNGLISANLYGLAYAYHFNNELELSIADGFQSPFSVNQYNKSLYSSNLDGDDQLGTVIPGLMVGSSLKSVNNFWYADINVMPYIPMDVDNTDLSISPDSLLPGLATDLTTGFNIDVGRQKFNLEVGKDINDYKRFSPSVIIQEHFKFGTDWEINEFNQIENRRFDIGLLSLKNTDTTLFWQQNIINKTNLYGTSMDIKRANDQLLNVSLGLMTWENVGQQQTVEQYVAVGYQWKNQSRWMSALTINELTQSIGLRNSAQFSLGKNLDRYMAIESNLIQEDEGFQPEALVRFGMMF